MIRLPRPLSAALCALVFALLSSNSLAGFTLKIDQNSFRFNGSTSNYEIDVLFDKEGVAANHVNNIALTVAINSVANGTPVDGAQVVGVLNSASNRLFTNALLPVPSRVGDFFTAAIQNNGFTPAPADPSVAMTLEINYAGATDANSNIEFVTFATSYISTGDSSTSFTSLGGAFGVTFIAVPEPNVTVLSALALFGVALRKRLRKRKAESK